jgi:hypothetical protein
VGNSLIDRALIFRVRCAMLLRGLLLAAVVSAVEAATTGDPAQVWAVVGMVVFVPLLLVSGAMASQHIAAVRKLLPEAQLDDFMLRPHRDMTMDRTSLDEFRAALPDLFPDRQGFEIQEKASGGFLIRRSRRRRPAVQVLAVENGETLRVRVLGHVSAVIGTDNGRALQDVLATRDVLAGLAVKNSDAIS